MRRLLARIVTVALIVSLAVSGLALASARVPHRVTRISVTLTFPLATPSGSHRTAHRTLTRAATVAEVVSATDALPVAHLHIMCPMFVRLGPVLTAIFRNARGAAVAEAQVQVVQGSHCDSGASACFPIRFTRGRTGAALVGNGWVRMMGRLIGTAIS
ncbi:MAG: hypothetical protein ACRDKL_12495 [Solirubrobacteraceae bacterium]